MPAPVFALFTIIFLFLLPDALGTVIVWLADIVPNGIYKLPPGIV
jgi:hypothetical protein